MEKERVLEFEIIKMNDFGIAGVLKQDTKILKRRTDTKYSRGYNFPSWDFINKRLYTYGDEKYDDLIFTVPKKDIDLFLDKINSINKEYGIPKRWRADDGERYYYINSHQRILDETDLRRSYDDMRYEMGNYFETDKEAQKIINSKECQDFWEKVRAGEIGG